MGMKKKRNQNGRLKKLIFFLLPFSIFFRENFRDWFLGEYDKLMQRTSMWLNLYGRQAVQRKLKKGWKHQFWHIKELQNNLTTYIVIEAQGTFQGLYSFYRLLCVDHYLAYLATTKDLYQVQETWKFFFLKQIQLYVL